MVLVPFSHILLSATNRVGRVHTRFLATTVQPFVLGRGGSGIKYYELGDGDASTGTALPSIHFCHEYKAVGDPLSGLAVLPPQSLDIARVEVARLLRLTATSVEPVSLMLPRSGDLKDYFQDDIYR